MNILGFENYSNEREKERESNMFHFTMRKNVDEILSAMNCRGNTFSGYVAKGVLYLSAAVKQRGGKKVVGSNPISRADGERILKLANEFIPNFIKGYFSQDGVSCHLEFTVVQGRQVFLDWNNLQSQLDAVGRRIYANGVKESLRVLNHRLNMNGLHPHNDVKPENTGAAVEIGPDGELLKILFVYHFDISTMKLDCDEDDYNDMRSGPYFGMEYSDCVNLVCDIIANNRVDWSLPEELRGPEIRRIRSIDYPDSV